MTQMVLEVYRAFKAANVPDAEAEAAARAVAEIVERSERIVTRDVLRAELERFVTKEHLDLELGKLRSELRAEIAALRGEMAALRAELRSEFKTELRALEERVGRRLYALFAALAILITIYEFIG